MNSPATKLPFDRTCLPDGGNNQDAVGLALEPYVDPMTSLAMWLLKKTLVSKFKHHGFSGFDPAMFHRPQFGVFAAWVADWRTALPILQEFAFDYCKFAKTHIARLDASEGIWRNLDGSIDPFERFLAQEHADAAEAEVRSRMRAADDTLAQLKRGLEG